MLPTCGCVSEGTEAQVKGICRQASGRWGFREVGCNLSVRRLGGACVDWTRDVIVRTPAT